MVFPQNSMSDAKLAVLGFSMWEPQRSRPRREDGGLKSARPCRSQSTENVYASK